MRLVFTTYALSWLALELALRSRSPWAISVAVEERTSHSAYFSLIVQRSPKETELAGSLILLKHKEVKNIQAQKYFLTLLNEKM
jgi:hypothetical protein